MKPTSLARKIRQLNRARVITSGKPRDWSRWLALGIVFVLTVLLTSPSVWRDRVEIDMGDTLSEPIYAEAGFAYFPPKADEAHQELRNREHIQVFRFDSTIRSQAQDQLEFALEIGEELAADRIRVEEAKELFQQQGLPGASWEPEQFQLFSELLQDDRFLRLAPLIIDDVYQNDLIVRQRARVRYNIYRDARDVRIVSRPPVITAETVGYPDESNIRLRSGLRLRLSDMIQQLSQPSDLSSTDDVTELPIAKLTERFFQGLIKPNLTFDIEATKVNFDQFPPMLPIKVAKGSLIAPALLSQPDHSQVFPHLITEDESAKLTAYASALNRLNLMKFGAQVLFVMIAFMIISFFVIKFSRELTFSTNTVLLLGLPMLLALGLGRFILLIGADTMYAGYAFPAGLIGILGVLLLDVRLAILMVTWGCLLFGLEADLEYEFVIVGLFGGYTAVAALYSFKERREVLYAGLLIGFVNAASILILNFISDGASTSIWSAAAVGALSGVLSSLISFAVLPVFEVLFNITTDLRLLELSGLQHPLLKRMEQEAPGTLQHTLNVSKLAEGAAQAIGVNYLLVRAGVYFHDIGKMAKPEYFTENQMTAEDKKRHNELRPQMSTLIIRNHVKEGLEMAQEHRLPKVIQQFISEHHGTTLIKYFYYKAKEGFEDGKIKEPVLEQDYRYPGPNPQTIESAVVMLADTVEAISTAKLSGREVREDDIQKLVREAISDKFNDGQFNECNLTMRDLNIIRESFVKTLRSRFHTRIDYPSGKKQQPKKRSKDEESGSLAISRDQKSKEKNPKVQPSKEVSATG